MTEITARINEIVTPMQTVSLPELAPLSLLDRMDTKFIVHEDQLCEALVRLADAYSVLEINGVRPGRYHTIYFDTEHFDMFFTHHNGLRYRYKLRCRQYLDSQLTFLEVKMKSNKERTIKFRKRIPAPVTCLTTVDRTWLPPSFPYALEAVGPVVWNRFRRMTLVNFARKERITIDIDIHFGSGNRSFTYSGLSIIEIKQMKFALRGSPLAQELHRQHIHPTGLSKYCIAASNYYPAFKANEFKPLLLKLKRNFPERGSSHAPE